MDIRLMAITSFGSDLRAIERAAEQPGSRQRYADSMSLKVGVPVMISGLGLGIMLTSSLLFGLILAMPGLLSYWKFVYLVDVDRYRVLALAGPQSRAFLEANWDRRLRLLKAASAYDLTLDGLRTLSSGDESESQLDLAESMVQRRRALDQDTDAYLREYEAATADDRRRFADMALEYEARAKALPQLDSSLDDFNEKVDRLKGLEAGLDHLPSAADAGMTVDLTPFVAARRIREELEAERERLVARGLKPKKLPPLRVSPKFLPAAT